MIVRHVAVNLMFLLLNWYVNGSDVMPYFDDGSTLELLAMFCRLSWIPLAWIGSDTKTCTVLFSGIVVKTGKRLFRVYVLLLTRIFKLNL